MEIKHLHVKITQKALITVEDKVLLVKDGPTWELPGGRVDEGELDLAQALQRELTEELSIEAKINSIFTTYLFTKPSSEVALAIVYECELLNTLDQIKKRTGEIDEWRLFFKEELRELKPVYPNTSPAIAKLLNEI